jgi:CDP-glucose 4,6-dehydratase
MNDNERAFWSGRRVLVTGQTGFKGAWLTYWLHSIGANVSAFALEPPSGDNLWRALQLDRDVDAHVVDIRNEAAVVRAVATARPQVVLHLAAQAMVRYGYAQPVETYETNVLGTVNVLEAVRRAGGAEATVVVTSDKCYRNDGRLAPYVEDDQLGGTDPYSASKAAAEFATASYRASFGRRVGPLATARAGNVIGGGDWGENRLVPDLVRSIRANDVPTLRYPDAIRPWQHVLEPLAGYLTLAQRLSTGDERYARAYNFGPDASDERTVADLTRRFLLAWDRRPVFHVPNIDTVPEAHHLTIDSGAANLGLGWFPRFNVDRALALTAQWYRSFDAGTDARTLCSADIAAYEQALCKAAA